MAWRPRIIHIIVCATSVVAVAGSLLATPIAAQRGRTIDAFFENGRFREAGIAFDVPSDWKYEGTVTGNTTFDETAHWTDPRSGIALYAYLSKQKTAPEEVGNLVRDAITNKTAQRERQGYRKWQVRSDSVQHGAIGGHQALFATADFEARSGAKRLECLAWIFASESRVL